MLLRKLLMYILLVNIFVFLTSFQVFASWTNPSDLTDNISPGGQDASTAIPAMNSGGN